MRLSQCDTQFTWTSIERHKADDVLLGKDEMTLKVGDFRHIKLVGKDFRQYSSNPIYSVGMINKVGPMMKSVISSDKHMLNQRERDALHHGPDFMQWSSLLNSSGRPCNGKKNDMWPLGLFAMQIFHETRP